MSRWPIRWKRPLDRERRSPGRHAAVVHLVGLLRPARALRCAHRGRPRGRHRAGGEHRLVASGSRPRWLLSSVATPVALGALATGQVAGRLGAGPPLAVADLATVVGNATAWLIGILAVLATFFLTLGGARYLSAGGDPAEVEKAKTALKSAGIGYGLALLAPVILQVLQQILGVGQ